MRLLEISLGKGEFCPFPLSKSAGAIMSLLHYVVAILPAQTRKDLCWALQPNTENSIWENRAPMVPPPPGSSSPPTLPSITSFHLLPTSHNPEGTHFWTALLEYWVDIHRAPTGTDLGLVVPPHMVLQIVNNVFLSSNGVQIMFLQFQQKNKVANHFLTDSIKASSYNIFSSFSPSISSYSDVCQF